MKLQHKTLLFILPIIIIPIMMIGAVAYYKIKISTEERLNTQVVTLLDQISQYAYNKSAVAEANLLLLADQQLIKQYALTQDESVRYNLLLPNVLAIFKNMHKSIPDYYSIKYILPGGYEDVLWQAEGIKNKSDSIAEDDYFEELKNTNKNIFKKLIFDKNTQKYGLLFMIKLMLNDPAVDAYGAPAKMRGYLSISVSLDHLNSEVNKNIIGKSGFLSVLNDKGEILFLPDGNKNDLTGVFTSRGINQQILQHLNSGNKFTVKFNDDSLLINSVMLPAGLHLLGVLHEDELSNSSRELSVFVVGITIISILVTTIAIFLALKILILRPLIILDNAARAIGDGQLDVDINIDSKDEIGSLKTTFIKMRKKLLQTHEEVSYTANHDGLTGLPNRSMFQKYLTNVLSITKVNEAKIALLFLDLDDFKQVNDTLGHHAGDVLLQEVALRLSGTLRKKDSAKSNKPSDIVARLGGDEFIILLNEIDGPFDAVSVVDRVLKKLKTPINIYDNQVYVNCSIGITIYPDDASDADELIKYADIAMYHAKEQGKNHYQFYSHKLNTELQNRLQMNSLLRIALEQGYFFLYYQPKVDAKSGKIVSFEALLRWNDSTLGMISPAIFIPIAEESGLITPITEWVFNEVCRQCVEWKMAGVNIVPVAINVSSIQFKRRDLVTMVKTSLQRTGLTAEYIEIELTETSLLDNTADAVEILNGLNELGINIALDDFGTGYSSLNYLNKLPIQTLKIDRSFINDIVNLDHDYPIVDAIIALAHVLDLHVVAEGVETNIQLEYLKNLNCELIQGYLFSKPLPADEVPNLLLSDFKL